MNIKGQLSKLFTLITMSGIAFASTGSSNPSTLPIGATDSEHYIQTITVSLQGNGANNWNTDYNVGDAAVTNDITITFPDDISLADTDVDGDYCEEISISYVTADDVDPVCLTAAAKQIIINLTIDAVADEVQNTDKFMVIFPVTTASDATDGVTAEYSIQYGDGTVEQGPGSSINVSLADTVSAVTFAANYTKDPATGAIDASSDYGDVFPAPSVGAAAVTLALPDFIESFAGEHIDGGVDWDGVTLNDDDADDMTYTLWMSTDPTLNTIPLVDTTTTTSTADVTVEWTYTLDPDTLNGVVQHASSIISVTGAACGLMAGDQYSLGSADGSNHNVITFVADAAGAGGDDLANGEVVTVEWQQVDNDIFLLTANHLAAGDLSGQNEDETFAGIQFNGTHADFSAGYKFYYVTSNATANWVVGASDSTQIIHNPVFDKEEDGTDATAVDYTANDSYDGAAGDKPVGGMYVSSDVLSKNIVGKDGSVPGASLSEADIYWDADDLDDDAATISVYVDTTGASCACSDGTDVSANDDNQTACEAAACDDGTNLGVYTLPTLTGLTADYSVAIDDAGTCTCADGTDVTSYDDGGEDACTATTDAGVGICDDAAAATWAASNSYTFSAYTDASTYEAAGSYYVYLYLSDGTNTAQQQLKDTGDNAFQIHVKHHPYFKFDPFAAAITFDDGLKEVQPILWSGSDHDGDWDLDDDATILIYASDKDYASSGAPTDASVLANLVSGVCSDVSYDNETDCIADTDCDNNGVAGDACTWTNPDPTGTVLVATITDDSDGQTDNMAMFDVRSSGLAAGGTYHIYAVISDDDNSLVIQNNSTSGSMNNTDQNDRPINLVHATFFMPINPVAGVNQVLNAADSYEFRWNGFDNNGANELVHIVLCESDGVISDYADFQAVATNIWVTSTTGDDDEAAAVDGSTQSSYVWNVSTAQEAADGNAAFAEGEYFVYYFFSTDGTFSGGAGDATDEYPYQADGKLTIGLNADADDATMITFSPNQPTVQVGDEIEFSVTADDAAATAEMITLSIKYDNTYFTPSNTFCECANGVDASAYNDSEASCEAFVCDDDNAGTDDDNAEFSYFTAVTANWNGAEQADALVVDGTTDELRWASWFDGGNALDAGGEVVAKFTLEVIADGASSADTLFASTVAFNNSSTDEFATDIITSAHASISPLTVDTAYVQLVASGQLAGYIDVQGRTGDATTVTVTANPVGSYSASVSSTVTLGTDDSYTLSEIPAGMYDVMVSKAGFLTQIQENVKVIPFVTTNLNFQGDHEIPGGDVGGWTDESGNDLPDNQIEASDAVLISAAFNTTSTDANWNAYADVDGSGTVYVDDLNYAAKNAAVNGDGAVNKELQMEADNSGAVIALNMVEENFDRVVYSVSASGIGSLHAYAIEMMINANEWEVLNISDNLKNNGDAIHFNKNNGYHWTAVSALYGNGSTVISDLSIIELKPLVDDPSGPVINEVTLIDDMNRSIKAVISNNGSVMPSEYALNQNFPNPFNPVTNIAFAIPQDGLVKLTVFDLMGKEVTQLVSSSLPGGNYTANWDATNTFGSKVSSGLYFYSLSVDNQMIATHKMILMK